MSWVIAALSSIEPMIFELINVDIFDPGAEWGWSVRLTHARR